MHPIFYSFRRCPYAIRARLALASSGVTVALREILLRDKPDAFLAASPSATVPCLVTTDQVIDESFDIMLWALEKSDPEGLLTVPQEGYTLIHSFDGDFKQALDRTKYAIRHPEFDPEVERAKAMGMLADLEPKLCQTPWLFDQTPTLADLAILPFIRQFAMIDKPRFDQDVLPATGAWLDRFLASDRLLDVMEKHEVWQAGAKELIFPPQYNT